MTLKNLCRPLNAIDEQAFVNSTEGAFCCKNLQMLAHQWLQGSAEVVNIITSFQSHAEASQISPQHYFPRFTIQHILFIWHLV